MEASTLIDPRVVDAATSVVPVVAHGPLEHGTFQAVENGRTVTRCRLYRNLECAEHQATHDALLPYQAKGRFRIPFTVWIDPEGKQLFRRDGWRRPDEFLFDIRHALGMVKGTRRSKAEYILLVKPLDDGLAALAAQDYNTAALNLEKARECGVAEISGQAMEGLAEIRRAAVVILARGKNALKAGRAAHARAALDTAARHFGAIEAGREALSLIRTLPFPLKSLSMETRGPEAGRSIHVRGDGAGVARIVETGRERRHSFTLSAAEWDELAKLFEASPFFDLPAAGATGPAVSVELWTGRSKAASKGGDAGFDAIWSWLSARLEAAAGAKPDFEGPHDPAWKLK
jgi:hypothetical protein